MARTKTELERTCRRCDTTWYAPKERKPSRMQIRGHRMSAEGSRLTIGGGRRASSHEIKAGDLERKLERIESLERCPSCGSQGCSEREVPIGQPLEDTL